MKFRTKQELKFWRVHRLLIAFVTTVTAISWVNNQMNDSSKSFSIVTQGQRKCCKLLIKLLSKNDLASFLKITEKLSDEVAELLKLAFLWFSSELWIFTPKSRLLQNTAYHCNFATFFNRQVVFTVFLKLILSCRNSIFLARKFKNISTFFYISKLPRL